ncbi:MAG: substrate-binding domain-containing protein, partial [Actinobacteria bacterium]|nr:substrate-binding domain-containing protein [Actinomycetota bacterium]
LAALAEAQIVCQQGAQDVSVPESFVGSMDLVNSALTGVCADQTLVEVPGDTAAGIKLIDHAPTAADLSDFAEQCPSGTISVPVFGYGVVVSYNVVGLDGLILTPDAIAGILNGSITAWDDPMLADVNADYDLTGLPPISVISIDSPQGAVEAITTWLTKEAPSTWTQGVTGTIATGTQVATLTDLIGELTATEGTLAVLPAVQAISNAVPIASSQVQEEVISADDTQLLKVGVAATTVTTDSIGNMSASPAIGGVPVEGNFNLAASKIVLSEGQPLIGWPVLGMAHLLICDDPANPLPLAAAQYMLRLAGQGSFETFGVTPLPEPIRVQTFKPLKVQVAGGTMPAASAAAE